MKKFSVLFLTIIIALSLCGCGNDIVPEKGIIEGSVYTSETLGIRFTAPDGWEYYSEEELEQFQDESQPETEETADSIQDMICVNMTDGSSINILYEDLKSLYGAILNEKSYIEIGIENIEDTLGDSVISADSATVEVDGTSFNCIKLRTDYDTFTMEQTMLVKKVGNYMVLITVSSFTEDQVSDILKCITLI